MSNNQNQQVNQPLLRLKHFMAENAFVSVTVWPRSIKLEKRQKVQNQWTTTEAFVVTKGLLEFLFAKTPLIVIKMADAEGT